MMEYQVNLYYGCEDNECGRFHSFVVTDPVEVIDDEAIKRNLAEQLDLEPDDGRFEYNSMFVNLPKSLVDRIKTEAIKEYQLAKHKEE